MGVTCYKPTCRQPIPMTDELEASLRRSGEAFHCIAGHAQHFKQGPDPRDERIRVLERRLQIADRETERTWRDYLDATRRLEAHRAAWLDDALGVYPAGVHEAPDGARVWIAPCGAHGRFLPHACEEHAAHLLNIHVRRHQCGPEIRVAVTA